MTPAPSVTPPSSTGKAQEEAPVIKRYFLYVLIGGLIASAGISIVAVLTGDFTETFGKAFATTVVLVIHALAALAFLSIKTQKSLPSRLLVDTFFWVVVASLLTAVLGIWGIFTEILVGDFYGVYFVAILTALIVSALLTAHHQDQTTRALMYGSVASVVSTFLLTAPYFFADTNYVLPEIYGRITWAFLILSATLVALTAIFDRLYTVKHPELKASPKPGAMPTWLKILLVLIVAFFCLPFIMPFLSLVIAGTSYSGF